MIYKLKYNEGALEFVQNQGRIHLEASSPSQAVMAARELFEHIREERVKSVGAGRYLVAFKVSLSYKLHLIRTVEKALKLLRAPELYEDGRYLDRYIVATVFKEKGEPDFLSNCDIKEEISSLRKAAVVAREVPNIVSFIDYDIAIYNYLELNNKPGFKSRVVRKVKA
jgi:hypothetical protein